MEVREYTDADFTAVKRIYEASGFGYTLPNLSGEGFFSRRVVGGVQDVGMACFLRRTAECYLISDPNWRTPAWRLEAIRQLHRTGLADAREAKVQEIIAFLPPQVEQKFGRRLKRDFGWNDWERGKEWRGYTLPV
jgi:hypothetical protein